MSESGNDRLAAQMLTLYQLRQANVLHSVVRGIFVKDQELATRRLIDEYYGEISRDETSPKGSADPTQLEVLLRLSTRLLMEIQAANEDRHVLTPSEKKSIETALKGPVPKAPVMKRPRQQIIWRRPKRLWIVIPVAVALAAIGLGTATVIDHTGHSGTPASVIQKKGPGPVQNIPITTTDLEQTRMLFGPWNTIAPSTQAPATNDPAILILNQDGSEIASTKWKVPFDSKSWNQRPSANIANLSLNGTSAQLTSSTNVDFIVHVNQAFIFEQNPGNVDVIDDAGHVWEINLAQATASRLPLGK